VIPYHALNQTTWPLLSLHHHLNTQFYRVFLPTKVQHIRKIKVFGRQCYLYLNRRSISNKKQILPQLMNMIVHHLEEDFIHNPGSAIDK